MHKTKWLLASISEFKSLESRVAHGVDLFPLLDEVSAWVAGCRGVFQSGQMGQTVNLVATPSQVRILPPPFRSWNGLALAGVAQR